MSNHVEIKESLKTHLKDKNVLLEAYPGWGKTKLAGELVGEYKRVLVVERTIEEVREVVSMSATKLIALYGKEKTCPAITSQYTGAVFYSMCKKYRLLGICRFKYEASNKLIRYIAGRFRTPEEIREACKKTMTCPYPSILALSNNSKVVATYGFVFSHPEVLQNRELVVFDESQELISAVLESVEVYDEQYIEELVEVLKKSLDTRGLAYAVRQCWRKSKSFGEFVECLDRQPWSYDAVDRISTLYRSKRSYVDGKRMVVAPNALRLPSSGCLFLTAYTPPFILDMIPNAVVIKVNPPPGLRLSVIIDDSVTSRYEERTEETYKAYAEKILDYYSAGDGNLILFPSYDFMERVKQHLPQEFLERVKPREAIRSIGEGDVVFDVASGTTTEGVNPSPALRRVIVAGLPYPPPTVELNALAKVYGFDNTYTYISLLKVVQSLGRLRFRQGADAVLIDRRYRNVLKFMPSYLSPV